MISGVRASFAFAVAVSGGGGVGGMLDACPGFTFYSALFSLTSVGVEVTVTVGVPMIVSGNDGNALALGLDKLIERSKVVGNGLQ